MTDHDEVHQAMATWRDKVSREFWYFGVRRADGTFPKFDPETACRNWGYCLRCQRETPGLQHRHAGGMNFSRRLVGPPQPGAR